MAPSTMACWVSGRDSGVCWYSLTLGRILEAVFASVRVLLQRHKGQNSIRETTVTFALFQSIWADRDLSVTAITVRLPRLMFSSTLIQCSKSAPELTYFNMFI